MPLTTSIIGRGAEQRLPRPVGERDAESPEADQRHGHWKFATVGEVVDARLLGEPLDQLLRQRGERIGRPVEARRRREKRAGIGMRGIGEHGAGRALLDDAAGMEHRHRLAELCDEAEVVGDEEHGGIVAVLEVVDQAQNLALHRDVEGGGRLVGDDEARPAGEGDGDEDALAHAAGQFVRIGREHARRLADGDVGEQIEGAGVARRGG